MRNLFKNLTKTFVVLFVVCGVFFFAACKKDAPEVKKVNINGFVVESVQALHLNGDYQIKIALTNTNDSSAIFEFSNIVVEGANGETYSHFATGQNCDAGKYFEKSFFINSIDMPNLAVGYKLKIKYVDISLEQNVVLADVIISDN